MREVHVFLMEKGSRRVGSAGVLARNTVKRMSDHGLSAKSRICIACGLFHLAGGDARAPDWASHQTYARLAYPCHLPITWETV
jgi:hypothetical protein